jgi:hypothetical protein
MQPRFIFADVNRQATTEPSTLKINGQLMSQSVP